MQNLDIALKNLQIFAFPPETSTYPAGWKYGGTSEVHTFLYCLSGSFMLHLEQDCYTVAPHQMVLLPANERLACHQLPGTALSFMSFPLKASCHNTDFFDFFGLRDGSPLVDMAPETVHGIFQGMQTFQAADRPMLAHVAHCVYAAELCTLYVQARIESEKVSHEFTDVIAYIEAHFAEDVSLDTLSRLLHYDPIYFSQKFKEKTGLSPIKFLSRLRIQKAAQLLYSTDIPTSEIATVAGFSTPYYFRTFFSKYVGLSPEDYRRRLARNQ